MRIRRSLPGLIVLFAVMTITACGGSSSTNAGSAAPVTLTVSAAASLQEAFNQIKTQFQAAHPNVTISYNFGGSQNLVQQIDQGAPVDVFASADTKTMQVAVQAGTVDAATPQNFVKNRLTIITPTGNPAGLMTPQDLAKPGIKVILAAKTVPVGNYALLFLAAASKDPTYGSQYQANVLQNVVSYEQDVKTVFNKISLGEADAGIVYTSDVAAQKTAVNQIAIPDSVNQIATYPIAPIKTSTHMAVAQQFIAYVLSADGQKVLQQWGFMPING